MSPGRSSVASLLAIVAGWAALVPAHAQTEARGYASASAWKLRADRLAARGPSPYHLPLVEDASCVLEDADRGTRRELRVLERTEAFDIPSLGGRFETAVLEEAEFLHGEPVSMTHRFLAVDPETGGVYTFGAQVWADQEIDRSWRAGAPDDFGLAEPGMVVPGTFEAGARWITRGAEGIALSGAEIVATGVTIETPAGTFEDCVRTRETDLASGETIERCWCPGVGLVSDSRAGLLTELDAPGEDELRFEAIAAANPPQPSAGARISNDRAAEIARSAVPGKVMDVAVERKLGAKRIVVEVIADEDLAETDVIIDMETGEVLGIEK